MDEWNPGLWGTVQSVVEIRGARDCNHGARNAGDELDGAQLVRGDALRSSSCRPFVACTQNAPNCVQQTPLFASFRTRLA